MIYLFYIHSHTTSLSALSIIKRLNLPVESIVFVTTRNYKLDNHIFSPSKTIDFSRQFEYLMKNKYHILKSLKKAKEIDDIINTEVGASYSAFIPHIGVYLMQIIASHPLCSEVRFIEEGSACYSKRLQSKKELFKGKIKANVSRLFFPSKRFWLTDLLYRDLYGNLNISCTYGISSKTFEFLPYKKEIIQWQKFGLSVDINGAFPIYIFDALIEMNFIDPQLYWNAVRQMIKETACNCNYIKFHPYQSTESRDYVKKQFELQKASYIELNQDVILENVIVNKQDLTFNGFSSSILLYAKLNKHTVNSYEGLLQNDKKYIGFRKLYDFEL